MGGADRGHPAAERGDRQGGGSPRQIERHQLAPGRQRRPADFAAEGFEVAPVAGVGQPGVRRHARLGVVPRLQGQAFDQGRDGGDEAMAGSVSRVITTGLLTFD